MAEILVVMGVSGSGKSTIADVLAQRLGWAFCEGDALHSPHNIEKMRSGIPLNDEDRASWLAAIGRWIDGQAAARQSGTVSCSALKRRYRESLRADRPGVRFLYLQVAPAVLQGRLQARKGHFMPASLLDSQLTDLEPPAPDEAAIVIDANGGIEETLEASLLAVRRGLA